MNCRKRGMRNRRWVRLLGVVCCCCCCGGVFGRCNFLRPCSTYIRRYIVECTEHDGGRFSMILIVIFWRSHPKTKTLSFASSFFFNHNEWRKLEKNMLSMKLLWIHLWLHIFYLWRTNDAYCLCCKHQSTGTMTTCMVRLINTFILCYVPKFWPRGWNPTPFQWHVNILTLDNPASDQIGLLVRGGAAQPRMKYFRVNVMPLL